MQGIQYRNKVVLVGTTHTGKTSIVQRYVNGQFMINSVSSMQAAFFQKNVMIGGKEQTLEIWDTAGQERFRSLTPMYYRDARVAIVVFDITDANSFSKAKQWINELKSSRGDSISLVLVGNKSDLEFIRVVQMSEAKQYAKLLDIPYFETSAKTGVNIEEVFIQVAQDVTANSTFESAYGPNIAQTQNQESSCC
ncbi:small GTP-binding protein, putative [Trichomonas vaginalis G3]|uniref:Ras-related protein Rab-21 n=2 Tax=Trichomonas vaginalis TaxID=5722 RepID=A0A8U0WQ12_TRIV3|nr:small Rab GTPase RabF2 [Trichomonas vaginalis G3]AAX97477.1 small Rab GTPase RabF2 [Trichomonas vaginalis]EAX87364.1 small GTP-binding protein, putative [Trichomonas vaginalis G3]KAI5537404.1 small Rab GTPase RabF2 [Trichomonas vaginalis G3]|eukprot:XP_001300294.1 small GTP-binding protein [Trichomonas vaginalis G3]